MARNFVSPFQRRPFNPMAMQPNQPGPFPAGDGDPGMTMPQGDGSWNQAIQGPKVSPSGVLLTPGEQGDYNAGPYGSGGTAAGRHPVDDVLGYAYSTRDEANKDTDWGGKAIGAIPYGAGNLANTMINGDKQSGWQKGSTMMSLMGGGPLIGGLQQLSKLAVQQPGVYQSPFATWGETPGSAAVDPAFRMGASRDQMKDLFDKVTDAPHMQQTGWTRQQDYGQIAREGLDDIGYDLTRSITNPDLTADEFAQRGGGSNVTGFWDPLMTRGSEPPQQFKDAFGPTAGDMWKSYQEMTPDFARQEQANPYAAPGAPQSGPQMVGGPQVQSSGYTGFGTATSRPGAVEQGPLGPFSPRNDSGGDSGYWGASSPSEQAQIQNIMEQYGFGATGSSPSSPHGLSEVDAFLSANPNVASNFDFPANFGPGSGSPTSAPSGAGLTAEQALAGAIDMGGYDPLAQATQDALAAYTAENMNAGPGGDSGTYDAGNDSNGYDAWSGSGGGEDASAYGFARGGKIPRPMMGMHNPPGPDDQMIAAMTGEGILSVPAMRKIGHKAFRALNEGKISREALMRAARR